MKSQKKHRVGLKNAVIMSIGLLLIVFAVWTTLPRSTKAPFCFDFSHDMQFGDRAVKHPVNGGKIVSGIVYYIPEVPALQVALQKQGFYIDPYEKTGGDVYAGAFFGPSTRAAVMAFQKKNSLPQTGQVTNDVIDKLSALYKCPSTTAPK